MTANGTARGTTPPIRVFLMDDHDLIRRGLRDLLEAEPDIVVVGEAGGAGDAIRDISALRPDVAILDLRVPDGTGVEVCRQVRTAEPDVACLILTSFDDRHALLAAIAAGASGFVLKEIRSNDLVAGVRTAAAGESLLNPAITEQILGRLTTGAGAPTGPRALNGDEISVLRLVADGLSDRQIGERLFMPERTIRLHFARLLVKLGLQGETGAPASQR